MFEGLSYAWEVIPGMLCCITPTVVQERRKPMATGALMIGWGPAVRGREQKALQVFNEAIQYYTRLQQQGTIESFEPVILQYHGGDLQGFVLLRGDREKLSALQSNEEFMRLSNRAALVVENMGIINAYIGEELQRVFTEFGPLVNELG